MNPNLFLLAGLLGLSLAANAREFKSADGSKTIDAEFVRYDTRSGNVTLKVSAGRNLVAPANSFSKEDVDYFIGQQKAKEEKDAFSYATNEKSTREENRRGETVYKLKNTKVDFSVRNGSSFDYSNLKVNYWVVVERENRDGQKHSEVIRGTQDLASLSANGSTSIDGPAVKLVQGASSSSSCPRVVAAAAAVDRERILGTKIQLLDADGKELYSDTSSNRIAAELSASE